MSFRDGPSHQLVISEPERSSWWLVLIALVLVVWGLS